MSTEVTSINAGAELSGLATRNTPSSVVQIAEWAAELNAAKQLGDALATSNFLPESITMEGQKQNRRPRPKEQVAADASVIILAGKSLGLDPLTSVQNLFSVRGRPAMYARTAVGLVMSHGHEIRRTDASPTSVTVVARRKGDKEWESFTWDMARANQAGYSSNPIYKSDPVAMLTAKAQMEACRTLFADILMGVPYSAEDLELEDLGEVDDKPKQTVRRQRKAPAKTAEKTAEEPQQDDQPAPEQDPETEPQEPEQAQQGQESAVEPITQQTWDEIKGLLKEKEPGESPGPWAMKTLGRTVKKWADFTQAEGDQMIELLLNGEAPEGGDS